MVASGTEHNTGWDRRYTTQDHPQMVSKYRMVCGLVRTDHPDMVVDPPEEIHLLEVAMERVEICYAERVQATRRETAS